MQFKVDENLPIEVADALHQASHDALTIHDQQMVGEPDPRVAAVCQAEERALLRLIWISPIFGPIHQRSITE